MTLKILNVLGQRPDATGSGIFVREIVRAGVERGDDVRLLCAAYPEDDFSHVFGTRVDTVIFPSSGEQSCVLQLIPGMSDVMPYPSIRYSDMSAADVASLCEAFSNRLKELVSSFQPDIIHLHHLWVLSSLAARFNSVPWVVTLHGTELKQLSSAPQHRRCADVGARQIAHSFCVSRDIAQDGISAFGLPPARVTVVGNGFDPDVFFPSAEIERADPPIVLCAGKFVDWKGFQYAIRASAQVTCNHRLVILGTGPAQQRARLQQEAKDAGIENRVEFPGHVSQEDVADWMRRALLFILPSVHEPFGLVLLEAMACGCHVVAAASGGPRDLITTDIQNSGAGTLIAPLDVSDPNAPTRYVRDLASAMANHLAREDTVADRQVMSARVRGMTWGRVYEAQQRVYRALPTA